MSELGVKKLKGCANHAVVCRITSRNSQWFYLGYIEGPNGILHMTTWNFHGQCVSIPDDKFTLVMQ